VRPPQALAAPPAPLPLTLGPRTDTVLDHLYGLKQRMRSEADLKEAASQYLIGQVVLTRYNNKTYHVDEVVWTLNPTSKFKKSTGEEMSYVDYYMKNYNLQIKDLQQPLLMNKVKRKFKGGQRGGEREEEIIYLIPELCCMTGFTEEVKSNFTIMRDISAYTIVPPASRRASLLSFITTLTTHPEIGEELRKWNISFRPEMLKLTGRVLNPERILFKNKQVNYDPRQADWSREIKQVDLLDAVPLRDWVIVYSERTRPAPEKFVQTLTQVGRPLGIQVAPPKEMALRNDRPSDFVEAIREAYKPGSTQLVVVILPDNRKERYDAVKKYCIADVGIVSQCVLVKTINNEKIMTSAMVKVLVQINVKLGGQLWGVEIPTKKTMVIGMDVYHDSLQKGTSVCGFIASTNDPMTKYFSRCLFQRSGQEIVDGLKVLFPDALRKYHELNGYLPERIIVFRDGVGEGQVNFVVLHEVRQMQECFATFGATYNPKFAFVIVTKRIGTRFMQDLGRTVENPPPGTLVNYGCTGADTYEYFIVAQAVRQGSVTPTAYQVVADSSGLQPIHLQCLTFKLAHLYYNWPGTVRVPAPCQYAHKLAFLIGQSVHKDPKLNLADKLYFL
jgi:aubergine